MIDRQPLVGELVFVRNNLSVVLDAPHASFRALLMYWKADGLSLLQKTGR